MYAMQVYGEIRAQGCREGSSGVFTGALEGLYQGYRFASSGPDRREYTIAAPHGTIALVLQQEMHTPLPPRPAEHPFAAGQDPFARQPAAAPDGEWPRADGGPAVALTERLPHMEVKLRVDPQKSTGIFAGATGEMELQTPHYETAGYLVIATRQGDLRLTFLEVGERDVLRARLTVDGRGSTGLYRNACGDLQFELTRSWPGRGIGPYSGTIWLENPPPSAP